MSDKEKHPSTFMITLNHLGYSPGGRHGYVDGSISGTCYVTRAALKKPEDEVRLLQLNDHPVLKERGHSFEMVDE